MFTVTFKGLWAHRRRLVGMLAAVVLGVGFLAGALALGDTLSANFHNLFASANAGTDALVRNSTSVGSGVGATRPTVALSLVDTIRSVPGVAAAEPSITGFGEIIGSDGTALGGNGPPRLATYWIPDTALNPYRLAAGRAPASPDEVVINRGAATGRSPDRCGGDPAGSHRREQHFPHNPPQHPRGLRGHRPPRGDAVDLQHLHDPHGPAQPGGRPAAGPRRHAPAGPGLRRRRGTLHRRPCLGSRPAGRARHRRAPEGHLRQLRVPPACGRPRRGWHLDRGAPDRRGCGDGGTRSPARPPGIPGPAAPGIPGHGRRVAWLVPGSGSRRRHPG